MVCKIQGNLVCTFVNIEVNHKILLAENKKIFEQKVN
jgi:hypothetical protein